MDRESIPQAKLFLETPAFEGAQVAYSWNQLEQGNAVTKSIERTLVRLA